METNFPNKLILHSFQFIICTNIPHRVLDRQQKRNLSFYNKGFQNFCVKLCYRHYKKINLQFFVFTWHFFPLWIDYLDKNYFKIIRTKLLHSFLKSSCIPYSVVRFWAWAKNFLLWTLHNFCYRHYTVKLYFTLVKIRKFFCLFRNFL